MDEGLIRALTIAVTQAMRKVMGEFTESGADPIVASGLRRMFRPPTILQYSGAAGSNMSVQVYPEGESNTTHVGFIPVAVRARFTGSPETAALTINKTEGGGAVSASNYAMVLSTHNGVGTGTPLFMKVPYDERIDPSPWYHRAGQSLSIEWTNPNNAAWELEVLIQKR